MERIVEFVYDLSIEPRTIALLKRHSLRVMFLSRRLARTLGVDDMDMKYGSLLHDIGKVGCDKNILFKPTSFSRSEYLIIKSHCHIGNTIQREHIHMPRAAEFVRDHHERWDGQGYPRGLSGQQISLQSQIISVSDSFDAMTVERRTYRRDPLPVSAALEEIARCAGSQFNPLVAEKFIGMIDQSDLINQSNRWYSIGLVDGL